MDVNQNRVERVVRVLGGALVALLGIVWARGWLGIGMGLGGALLVFSGTIGFCHVYKFLHIDTSAKR